MEPFRVLLITMLLLWPTLTLSAELRGKVVSIADGDTIALLA